MPAELQDPLGIEAKADPLGIESRADPLGIESNLSDDLQSGDPMRVAGGTARLATKALDMLHTGFAAANQSDQPVAPEGEEWRDPLAARQVPMLTTVQGERGKPQPADNYDQPPDVRREETMRQFMESPVQLPNIPVGSSTLEQILAVANPTTLPQALVMGPAGAAQTTRSAANAVKGLGEFMIAPAGILTTPLAAGVVGKTVATLIKLGFSADMARATGEQAGALVGEWDTLPEAQRVDRLTGLGFNAALAASLATHSATEAAQSIGKGFEAVEMAARGQNRSTRELDRNVAQRMALEQTIPEGAATVPEPARFRGKQKDLPDPLEIENEPVPNVGNNEKIVELTKARNRLVIDGADLNDPRVRRLDNAIAELIDGNIAEAAAEMKRQADAERGISTKSSESQATESPSASNATGLVPEGAGDRTGADVATSNALPVTPPIQNENLKIQNAEGAASGTVAQIEAEKPVTAQRVARVEASKPYSTEQALQDLPSVVAELKAVLEANRLKPPGSPESNVQSLKSGAEKPTPAAAVGDASIQEQRTGVSTAGGVPLKSTKTATTSSEFTILDAVKEHGPLGGPDLESAMRQMDEGRTAAQVTEAYGGEYDGLADVLETIYETRQRKGSQKQYAQLAKAYELAGFGGDRKGIDTALGGMKDAHFEGRGVAGGVPADEYDLVGRAWEAAQRRARGERELPQSPEGKAELFYDTATKPGNAIGLRKVYLGDLKPGNTFRLRGEGLTQEELTVRHVDAEAGTVQVKGGEVFGTQDLPAEMPVHVMPGKGIDRASMTARSEGDFSTRRAAKWWGAVAKGKQKVFAKDLREGDVLTVADGTATVTERMPDGTVMLDGGKAFGDVQLGPKAQIFVDKFEPNPDAIYGPDGAVDPVQTALKKLRDQPKKESQIDAFEDWLDRAISATDIDQTRTLEGVTGAPVWLAKSAANAALRVVRAAYKGGKAIKEAIEEGLDWLRAQKIKDFDETEARRWLLEQTSPRDAAQEKRQDSFRQTAEQIDARMAEDKANEPPKPRAPRQPSKPEAPPDREREVSLVKTEMEAAKAEVHQWVSALAKPEKRGGLTQSETKQQAALANAKYQNMRDELLHHPDYIAEQIKLQHDAVVEANAMLKPHGMAVHPEEFPNPFRLREVLTPEQFKRLQELSGKIEESHAEIGRMPKKMVSRIMDEMRKDGRLPELQPMTPNAGRTLDNVTDWLREHGIESPKLSLAERLNLGGRFADVVQNARTSLQKARMTAAGIWKAALESYKSPPKDGDFRNVIKSWIYADQRTGLATHQFVKELTAKIPSNLRRRAMAVWLDAAGDVSTLRFQAQSVPAAYERIWKAALQLTPDEKALALKIKSDFDAKLEDGLQTGLIEKGREDYGVPQRWKIKPEVEASDWSGDKKKGTPGKPTAKLDSRSPFFSFQRETPSYFDGIMAKGVPENLDIAHLVSVYDAAFHKSLSSRGMIAALQEAKAKDGLPVVKLSGSASMAASGEGGKAYFVDSKAWNKSDVTADGRPYQSLDHSSLKGWKLAFKDAEGNPIIVKGDMLIHPDHYAYLKNELGHSALREVPIVRGLLKSQAFLKASKLSASFFHLATIGEHMASHLVNPFLNGFKIDLRDPTQSLLVRNGLELGMSYPQAAFEEGLMSAHSGLFNKIPGLGDLSAKMTDWMFKDYIPAIMMKAGLHAFENNLKRYSKDTIEGKALTRDQIAELTAQQMNAAGGLLNYRLRGAEGNMWGRLGANKVVMDLQRMALMAPQFLEARMRVVGQALKPYGHEQRKMLLFQAGVLFIGARVLNQMFDDDPHWTDNPFSVVIKGRAYSIRTIVGDFWHMITDPWSFAAGRLSPFGRIGIEAVTGRDLRTGARKEPPIDTNNQFSRTAQNIVVDLANWLTPITVEGMLPGASGREQTAVGMALASVGIGSRKFTATMQTRDLAAEFNRNSSDPAAREYQKKKEGGAFPESAYRKLDTLLDAGDVEHAKQELKSLIEEGKTLDQIAARYGRNLYFTGRAAREQAFVQSLTPKQRKVFDEARAERAAREQAFNRLLRE